MALKSGDRLSIYEIVTPLGSGAMGEVYRARDTRLERDVAIKVLPAEFADDPDRLGRFEREAKLLATVSHANIAGIYGVEDEGGTRFIVLELVPGITLGERIAAGPLPVREVLSVARQIAEGLEAAHEAGVVHRDLKPDNIRITPQGAVKLLDFGLAKSALGSQPDSVDLTQPGVILGTPYSMSPEQVQGRPVDRRTDIWAFGCVLYEALTGLRAFPGDTLAEVAAHVLEREPDWSALPADTPLRLRDLLAACLTKDPRNRLRDIGDARRELQATFHGTAPGATPSSASAPGVIAIVSVVAALVVGFFAGRAKEPESVPVELSRPVVRLSIPIPAELRIERRPRIAPDGSIVAAVGGPANAPETERSVYVWRMADGRFERLDGTDGVVDVEFSPSGRRLAVRRAEPPSLDQGVWLYGVRAGALGTPERLFGVPREVKSWGWLDDDELLYVTLAGLWTVPLRSGKPVKRVDLELELDGRPPTWLSSPRGLPGGRAVLVAASFFRQDRWSFDLSVVPLGAGRQRVLAQDTFFPLYWNGYVLYARGNTLMADGFSLGGLGLQRPHVTLLNGLYSNLIRLGGWFDLATANGTLVYVPGGRVADRRRLVKVDRKGVPAPWTWAQRAYFNVAASPDGRVVAAAVVKSNLIDIWVDREGRAPRPRDTVRNGDCFLGFVSGDDVYYGRRSNTEDDGIYRLNMTRGEAERLISIEDPATETLVPVALTADGKTLVYYSSTKLRKTLRARELRDPESDRLLADDIVAVNFAFGRALSADGKSCVFASDESGDPQIYLAKISGADVEPLQLTTTGGDRPFWSADGSKIHFRSKSGMLCEMSPEAGAAPTELFNLRAVGWVDTSSIVALLDGTFLMAQMAEEERRGPREIRVVLNWTEEFARKAAAAR